MRSAFSASPARSRAPLAAALALLLAGGDVVGAEPVSFRNDVMAVLSRGGCRRDVTRLAGYEAANDVAEVTPGGLVRRERYGEAVVLVRYLDRQAAVRLAFVPARPGFVWEDTPENNFVDRHVFARLRTLR